ncbi:MAG: hypothetical protein M1820_001681 [Bogoriella megaspora]|nr:MAG: hypothetical protein M1820_001681 [Bogoriella megaspora]
MSQAESFASRTHQSQQPPALGPARDDKCMRISYIADVSPSREERLEYTDEEEFAIMYMKVVLGLEWKAITERMNARFPGRSRSNGGLSSKYYRIREKWDMSGARVGGGENGPRDVEKVSEIARRFDARFVASLGQ